MPRISRYKLRDSDRSGFTYLERELVKEGALKVHPDEFDLLPPSRRALGGEGEVSGDPRDNSDFLVESTTARALDITYVQAGVTITPILADPANLYGNTINPWMQIVGSNADVTMSANPQITAGRERQVLSLYGVGSSVTFIDGNGLSLMGARPCTLHSGNVLTLYYNTANTVWQETSRTP